MASHNLSNMKTTILEATPGEILGIDGNPRGRFSFALVFSERFFKNWGGPRVQDLNLISKSPIFTETPCKSTCLIMQRP